MALGGATSSFSNGRPAGTGVDVVIGQTFSSSSGYVLEINGSAYAGSGGVWTPSDKRFKKNIVDLKDAMSIIKNLHPVKYEYRDDIFFPQQKGDTSKPVRMAFSEGNQIGFLAQELEQYVPQAVMTRGDGYKAVNYNHLFGLLVQGMKEQQQSDELKTAKIAQLETDLSTHKAANETLSNQLNTINDKLAQMDLALSQCCNAYNQSSKVSSDKASTDLPRLEQNSPNPFSDNTVVKYFIPENTVSAKIVITSGQGIEVMSYIIKQKGNGSIVVSGNTLQIGSYNCTLVIDGKSVYVKKMILIK